MEDISDDVLLHELKKRFLDNKKALHAMKVMNEKIEKLNAKLTESERVKTNFLSNIRNEINNPLSSILGMAQRLAGAATDEETRKIMSVMIYTEAFDLDFQLRNIFTAAELEAGEAELSLASVDLASLVKRASSAFSHKLQEKNVTVDLVCDGGQEDGRIPFGTDPEKLHLVIANLLANAIEYSPAGKSVRVQVRKEEAALRLSVSDQGAGMAEEEREHLFERFHQLDQGASKKHRGHGLGLCITKALVEMLGGKVSAGQAAGGGSVFQVDIPEAQNGPSGTLAEDGNEFLFEDGTTF